MPRDRVDWFGVVEKIEAGDAASLLRLTSLVAGLLARVGAYRRDESHEDLVQETTVALVEAVRRGAIRERDAFVGYAWTAVRNRWLNVLRSRERRRLRGEGPELHDIAPADLDPGAPQAADPPDPGSRVDLERALETLPGEERGAVEAIYLLGRSYEEAAEALALPLGTLKRRLSNGLKLLRGRLQPDGSFM